MTRRYPLLIFLTLVVVLAGAHAGFYSFKPQGLPFVTTVISAHTAVITPVPGLPLPSALRAGDEVDLPALDQDSRIAIFQPYQPAGESYDIVIRRHDADSTIPVTAVDLREATDEGWIEWLSGCISVLISLVALLLLWRGRDRAALAMMLWVTANLVGSSLFLAPLSGVAGLSSFTATNVCFLLARLGFYLMVDIVLGRGLSSRARALYRACFVLCFLAAAVVSPAGSLLFVATGWAELQRSAYGYVFAASYILPVVMLASSYGAAEVSRRLKLRWMLWSSVVFVLAVLIGDTLAFGFLPSVILDNLGQLLGMLGFLYALLRHRVVDISVVIDRTLVYGGVTALVVGVLAAVNSMVQHAALGTGAGLLLQVMVPLSLGIVLSRVRAYVDRVVEQVFFRGKYRAEKSLKRFARHCAEFAGADEMLRVALLEIQQRLATPGGAVYERRGDGYARVHLAGESAFPERIKLDDVAFVAARADSRDFELADFGSALGAEGHVFPMTALGGLQGVLVCANRPGEHFAADERKLLAHLAHHLGLALHLMEARESREFVRSLARGGFDSEAVKARAQSLEGSWAAV